MASHPRQRAWHPASVQYARDIIYPALALRKLCAGRVQVTPKDLQQAFESQYAEKIRCRMILVDTQAKAVAIWEKLRENPGGFEAIATEQSMDTGSRSLGGLLGEPITRHAYPQTLTDAAFPATLSTVIRMTRTRATSRKTVASLGRSRSTRWSGSSSAANRSYRPSRASDSEKPTSTQQDVRHDPTRSS